MDMQGTPIGSTSQGMKNTSDPASKHPSSSESAGPVTKDSLAAESKSFQEDNKNSAPLAVSGENSTFANTDTSSATTLAPAPDAVEREAKAAWQETSDETKGPGGAKYSEAVGGQGEFPGSHNADGYAGGSTEAKKETAAGGATYDTSASANGATGDTSSGVDSGSAGGASADRGSDGDSGSVDAAPGYISSVVSDATKSGKPKGKNITEGGFDSNPDNNASFTSDIGDENDPGRAAENKFQRQTMESGADAGGSGPRQKELTKDGQYDVLETEQSA